MRDSASDPQPSLGSPRPSPLQEPPARPQRRPRALVACSDPGLAEVVRSLLRELRPRPPVVDVALDARSLARRLEGDSPELLVLHARLDGAPVEELLESVRARAGCSVILLSSLFGSDVPRCPDVPALRLPFDAAELLVLASERLRLQVDGGVAAALPIDGSTCVSGVPPAGATTAERARD